MSERQRINILSKKDLDISYFCGSGPGGQARNKVASGVQIIHHESGALGRASDSRSQDQNRQSAFNRLMEHPKMKFWLARKLYEIQQQETMEETIIKETAAENLKIEIKDKDGKWTEVSHDYFETQEAKTEV